MKKFLKKAIVLLVFTGIAVASVLSSCSKDDDDSNPLIGKWGVEQFILKDVQSITGTTDTTKYISTDEEYFTIEFKNDNSYSILYPNTKDRTASGTYTLSGSEISIKSSTNFTNKATYEISNNKLTLTSKNDNGERIETYKKL